MNLQIVQPTAEKFRPTRTIPFHYFNSLSSFAKPVVLRSTYVDIVYHERTIKGCTLRNMVFHVKEAVTLSVTLGNPMTSIHCMLKGTLDFHLNGLDKVSLNEGEYNILQLNTDEHILRLLPGTYELQRYDYAWRIINERGKEEWRNKLYNNELAISEHGPITERLKQVQEALKHATIKTPEQEEWFYWRLRKYLKIILEEQAIDSRK